MKAFGHSEITTIDDPDGLQFVVVRANGYVDFFAPIAALLAFGLWAVIAHHFILVIISTVGLFSLLASYARGPVTRLAVSQYELVASGNLDRTFTDHLRVETKNVKSLGYFVGYENEPSGLYADQGWRQTCLLPGVSKEEADTIAETIRGKFPDLERGDTSSRSLLYSESSGIQTLGLAEVPAGQPLPGDPKQ